MEVQISICSFIRICCLARTCFCMLMLGTRQAEIYCNLKPSVTSSSGLLTISYLLFTFAVKLISSSLGSTILGSTILTNLDYNYNLKIGMLKLKILFCFAFTLVAFLPGLYGKIQKWQTSVMHLIKKCKSHTSMSESGKSCLSLNICFYQTRN